MLFENIRWFATNINVQILLLIYLRCINCVKKLYETNNYKISLFNDLTSGFSILISLSVLDVLNGLFHDILFIFHEIT